MDDPITQEFAVACALISAYLEDAVQRGLSQAQRRLLTKHIVRVRELAGEQMAQQYVESLVRDGQLQAHAELLELLEQLEAVATLSMFDDRSAALAAQVKRCLEPPGEIKYALRASISSSPLIDLSGPAPAP